MVLRVPRFGEPRVVRQQPGGAGSGATRLRSGCETTAENEDCVECWSGVGGEGAGVERW